MKFKEYVQRPSYVGIWTRDDLSDNSIFYFSIDKIGSLGFNINGCSGRGIIEDKYGFADVSLTTKEASEIHKKSLILFNKKYQKGNASIEATPNEIEYQGSEFEKSSYDGIYKIKDGSTGRFLMTKYPDSETMDIFLIDFRKRLQDYLKHIPKL
jgi:hypothetical protein